MFTVYGLLCNGLRDPRGVFGRVRLTWRLGSDRNGARQRACRVVVVSMTTGDVVWDTGEVARESCCVDYAGEAGSTGEVFSWFVTAIDDEGNEAYGVPAAFVWGARGDVATSELGAEHLGFMWTSDDDVNESLAVRDVSSLDDYWWRELLGVRMADESGLVVHVEPCLARELSFLQGSLLLVNGLVVVRCERHGRSIRLEVTLPPGMSGELVLAGKRRRIASGRYLLES